MKPLGAPYSGPYKVIKKEDKYFIIETSAGDEQYVSTERFKPAIFTHAQDRNKNFAPNPNNKDNTENILET